MKSFRQRNTFLLQRRPILSSILGNSNKQRHPRVISRPSLGDVPCQPLSSSTTVSTATVNRFSPLATILPEYTELIEVDTVISLSDGKEVPASALLDTGSQGSLIDDTFVQKNAIPLKPKPEPMILKLADGEEALKK